MRYELSIALKYLTPRVRQLSVSIISLISMIVIALVVWLIVVFFSVTYGLEKTWTEKLISLTAPIRITPKEAYYQSYYYQIDHLAEASDYTPKSIAEKRNWASRDPYNPYTDEELPSNFPPPLKNEDGSLKDLVKTAFQQIEKIPGTKPASFQLAPGHIKLKLVRQNAKNLLQEPSVNFVTTPAYLTVFDPSISTLNKSLLPIREEDVENVLHSLSFSIENIQQEESLHVPSASKEKYKKRIQDFFSAVDIVGIRSNNLILSPNDFKVNKNIVAVLVEKVPADLIIVPSDAGELNLLVSKLKEKGLSAIKGRLKSNGAVFDSFIKENDEKISLQRPKVIFDPFQAINTRRFHDSAFEATFFVQGNSLKKKVAFNESKIQEVRKSSFEKANPFWVAKEKGTFHLPTSTEMGDPILLPKTFRDSGVLVGDLGYLAYQTLTTSSIQEQRIPIVVAGFYDPGIFPVGARIVLTTEDVLAMASSNAEVNERIASEGIHVRLDDLAKTDEVKQKIAAAFEKEGLKPYFHIESYKEYEFTKEIIQQLRSEKNLFTLLATVIIVVACSNIISMLIILVNDKKKEIGILRSMGSSTASIGLIFGAAGVLMGFGGSLFGIAMALFTLRYLNHLVNFISRMQGFDLFSAHIYGDELPTELSFEALAFVILATVMISLIAGCIPAIKACLMKPSEILRAE